MDDDLDELMVSVRADTAAFAQDVQTMKRAFDTGLLGGFDAAGKVLESSLMSALQSGKLGFEDLRRTALSALEQIAARALGSGLDQLVGGIGGGGSGANTGGGLAQLASLFTSAIGSFLGLPGRATGGLVGPDRPYVVGENGPEVFMPTSAGRIEPNSARGTARNDVRVSINLAQPRGADAPAALQRSSRQVASAVRRALSV